MLTQAICCVCYYTGTTAQVLIVDFCATRHGCGLDIRLIATLVACLYVGYVIYFCCLVLGTLYGSGTTILLTAV